MITHKIKYGFLLLAMILTGSSVSPAQETDSLRHYLRIAAQNNPAVKADFLAYEAALQKVPQAGAYEDPKLDMGFFIDPMDDVGGKRVADFTIMQMFPWFGTKKAAKSEATHMAKATYEQFRETRNAKFLEIYTQWYILNNIQQKLKNNGANKQLLEQLRALAIRKFSSPSSTPTASYTPPAPSSTSTSRGGGMSSSNNSGGSMGAMGGMGGASASATTSTSTSGDAMGGGMSSGGSMGSNSSGMSEVLRIELEITELDSNMETLLSEMKTEKAKFNTLLNRPTSTELVIPETFRQVDYIFDISTMDQVKNSNPMLEMINEEGQAYKAMGEMNKKMSYPMFGIGVQYMLINKTSDTMLGMGSMNGKDMVMPMVSMTIPLYRNKYKAQQKESKIWWNASREKYSNTINTLEAELLKTKHQLDDASRKIALYKKQSELAQTTYNLAVREFISGKNDLTNIIQVQRQLLDYQLKESEAVATYNTIVASIQKLISFSDIEYNNK